MKPSRFEKRLRSYTAHKRSPWKQDFMVYGGSWRFAGSNPENPLNGPGDTTGVRVVAESRQDDNGLRLARKPFNCIRRCE